MNVIVTGASSGIGRALAELHAGQGHQVCAIARRNDVLVEMATRFPTITPEALDVTDQHGMAHAIERFASAQNGLSVVYANAGIGQQHAAEAWDPRMADTITRTNILGTLNTVTPALVIMMRQRCGRIVGISSLAGVTPMPGSAVYGSSKAWMAFYLRSLELDLTEEFGIGFTVVMPGHVSTAMVDGAGIGLVTDSARRAAAVIADGAAKGKRIIAFPQRVAFMARLSAWIPAQTRARMQKKRLAKRRAMRGEKGLGHGSTR